MQQDMFRENGNGSRKLVDSYLKRERRARKAKRRRSDISIINLTFIFINILNKFRNGRRTY